MSIPGGNAAERFGSPVDPEALIASLNLNQLAALNGLEEPLFKREIQGPWLHVVRTERLNRERALEGLRTFRPALAETPPFDEENLDAYFAQARAVNLSTRRLTTQVSDRVHVLPEVRTARGLAGAYVNQRHTLTRLWSLRGVVNPDELADFFEVNLYGVTGTAHSIALRQHEAARNAAIREHFPGANLSSRNGFEYWARERPITRAQVEAAREDVLASAPAYVAPYPDFFQLTREQQGTIVQALGREWEELCQLLHGSAPGILTVAVNRATAPLAYLPVQALREALEANPTLDATQICYTFLRTPEIFQERVMRLRSAAAIAKTMREMEIAVTPRPDSPPGQRLVEAPQTAETDFLRYDHARVTVGEQGFFIALDRANSILATRILQMIGNPPKDLLKDGRVDGMRLATQIWRAMPESERRLFTSKERELTRKSGILDTYVLGTLRSLTSRLGVTRETSGESFQIRTTPAVRLMLRPANAAVMETLTPIFPPGTTRERMLEFAGDILPDEYIEIAGTVLDSRIDSARPEPLTQSEALRLLSFITDRNGKRALFVQLEKAQQTPGDRSVADALDATLARLHGQIERTLGEAYNSAFRYRMIGGNHSLGDRKVGLVSGTLPTTTKWHIGVPTR